MALRGRPDYGDGAAGAPDRRKAIARRSGLPLQTLVVSIRRQLSLGKLRPLLADYGGAVVGEWPFLALGQSSEATDAAFAAMSKKARANVSGISFLKI